MSRMEWNEIGLDWIETRAAAIDGDIVEVETERMKGRYTGD